MKMTGIIYTGEPESVLSLYDMYCDRLDREINVSIIGDNSKYLGAVTEIKMNPQKTILYATLNLNLTKDKQEEWKYIETKIEGEHFIRRFPIKEVK